MAGTVHGGDAGSLDAFRTAPRPQHLQFARVQAPQGVHRRRFLGSERQFDEDVRAPARHRVQGQFTAERCHPVREPVHGECVRRECTGSVVPERDAQPGVGEFPLNADPTGAFLLQHQEYTAPYDSAPSSADSAAVWAPVNSLMARARSWTAKRFPARGTG